MRCINCGYDNDENAHFCIKCGSGLAYNQNPLKEIMPRLVKDSLFLVICILYTTGIVFSLINRNMPIIEILMALFLWLLYAQCKKETMASNYMRCISGTIFASYVVRWVVGCLVVIAGCFLVATAIMMESSSQWRMIYSAIWPYIDRYNMFDGAYADMFLVLFSFALIFGAIIALAVNAAGLRSIHRFAQSIYKSFEDGKCNLVKCGAARTWLMVFGVFDALSALRSREVFSLFAEGCMAAALIISSVLVKKYFKSFE